MGLGRWLAGLANHAFPGKRRAALLLVANERTRRALPAGGARVVTLVENGVDVALWKPVDPEHLARPGRTRFVFLGRLVGWKAVDLLLEALAACAAEADVELEVIGDGEARAELEEQAAGLGLAGRVSFHGFLPQEACAARLREAHALVLPSLYECGGAVVLEAMAMGLPVIATQWGGPAEYLAEGGGLQVEPSSREAFVAGLADALRELAACPERRVQLGREARAVAVAGYDWERKIDRILELYREVLAQAGGGESA